MNRFFSLLNTMKLYFFSLVVLISFGCKETKTITGDSIITTKDELTDPNISPAVVWTFPSNNSIGPYTVFNNSSHYFTVQFNKMMNVYTFNSTTVKIKGFNQTVYVYPSFDGYYPYPQFQNIIKCYVRNSPNGNYVNFEIGKTYTVEIDSTLEDIHGKRLSKKYSFSFTPEPFFRVRSVYPLDGDTVLSTQYPYQTYPVITFNSMLSSSSLKSLHITPSVSGKWSLDQYSNTSSAYFIPTSGYNFNTKYTVTADQGMKDSQGNTLAQTFISSFITSAFKVTSTSPQNGASDVSPSSNVNIYVNFSGAINSLSGASAFSITPAVNGTVNINGNQIYFYSNEYLVPGTKYIVRIDTTLTAKNGAKLSQPYSFEFTTEEFRITNTEPYYGSTDISPSTQIRFSFNAAIDPVSAMSALTFDPSVQGSFSFQYYDNKTFVFTPTQPLKYGTTYTATLSTGMKSIGGAVLNTPYELQFTTIPFRVTYTNPSNGTYDVLPSYIEIYFSGSLDVSSVQNAFSISPSITGNLSVSSNRVVFSPTQAFSLGKKYTVTLSTGIKGQDGSSLQTPYTFSFTTPSFKVTGSEPSNGNTYVYPGTNIIIYTNAPVDINSAQSAFTISPNVAGALYQNGNGFYFDPQNQLATNTSYTVTVSTKLKSTSGDTLLAPWVSTFRTWQ